MVKKILKIEKPTAEDIQKNNSAVQPTEAEKETIALNDDLTTKKAQLKNDEVNLYGGNVNIGQGIQTLEPLPERLRVMIRSIEKTKLQMEGLVPIAPKFEFEFNPRYIEIQKEEIAEEMKAKEKVIADSVKLRDELKQRIPVTKKEINELEKKLKLEITDFKNVKPNYIG